MILCPRVVPKTSHELNQILEAIVKNLRGKSGQPKASILDGYSTAPLAIHHHNLFTIPKGETFQIIYDCRQTKGRYVYLEKDTLTWSDGGTTFMKLIPPPVSSASDVELANVSFNMTQPNKSSFQAPSVDIHNSRFSVNIYVCGANQLL